MSKILLIFVFLSVSFLSFKNQPTAEAHNYTVKLSGASVMTPDLQKSIDDAVSALGQDTHSCISIGTTAEAYRCVCKGVGANRCCGCISSSGSAVISCGGGGGTTTT